MKLLRGLIRLGIVLASVVPLTARADYLYPGTAGLQPLAVIEPAAPDALFNTWTGDLDRGGSGSLGLSLDFLRNADNSEDWDVIAAATGSFRVSDRLLVGLTVPYIVRDPDFNESDILDLRTFARMRLLGDAASLRLSGEISVILPTAGEDNAFPYGLESTVVGGRLAVAGGRAGARAGAVLGYQSYLATESGDDADLLCGIWVERTLNGPWSLAAEIFGSTHMHSGAPGDDEVSDNYAQVGIRRSLPERLNLGVAVSGGLGGDSAADLRIKASAVYRFAGPPREAGAREEAQEPSIERARGKDRVVAGPYRGPVVVMIAEGVAAGDTEKRIARVLQSKGYATGMDPGPDVKIRKENVLYYNPGMLDQAVAVSRALVMGGHLKELTVEENREPRSHGWLLLVPGAER